tara:strand:+ start:2166 stop:2732 length:567 start_codon:yes stop_codon:yes gene_type:complete
MSLSLSFFKAPSLPAALSDLSAKSFKTDVSHDGAALTSFDLFIGKVKIGRVYEDDWSGSIMLDEISPDTQKLFDEYCQQREVIKYVREKYAKDVGEEYILITIYTVFREINNHKSITRKSVRNIMVGKPNQHYAVNWKKTKLEEMPAQKIQDEITKLIAEAKKNGIETTLLNTPEQLKSLGVEFTAAN